MRKLVIGILAHVDAGKTTLSEGMLYTCGTLKRLGRGGHQDALLDTEAPGRERALPPSPGFRSCGPRWRGAR